MSSAATAAGPEPGTPLRRFALLWCAYFAAIGAFNPYAPLWFKELGFSTLAIGAVASLQAWTRVFAPYAWGWWGDHHGSRARLILWTSLASLACAAMLLWVRGYSAVATVVVLLFVVNGALVPLSESLLAQHLPSNAQGELDSARYARVRVWGSVGFIAAVLLCGFLLEHLGITAFPWLVVLMYAALVVVAWRLPRREDRPHADARPAAIWPVLRQPPVAWFFGSVFFTVLAHTAVYVFFSLYLVENGWGKSTVGLLWGVAVLVEIVFFWAQGRLIPRFDALRWLAWSSAVSVLRFALTALGGGSIVLLVLAQAMHAVTFAAQHVACIVLINRHFPAALRSRGQALYSVLGYGLSGVIGGVGGGWLSQQWGLEAVFWAASAAAAAGWYCAWRARTTALGAAVSVGASEVGGSGR